MIISFIMKYSFNVMPCLDICAMMRSYLKTLKCVIVNVDVPGD